jgi:S1-C subfamily serine protease
MEHARLICSVCLASTILTACGSKQPQAVPVLPVARVGNSESSGTIATPPAADSELTLTAEVVDQNGPQELTDPVLQRVTGSTVRVVGRGFSTSGVLLGKDPHGRVHVLTVWHGARERVERVEVYSITSREYPQPNRILSPVQVVSTSERRDLAILRTAAIPGGQEDLPCLRLASTSTVASTVFSCGCEDGPPMLLSEKVAEVVSKRRPGQDEPTKMWKTELPQDVGRSGGPLINLDGDMIGIALGKAGRDGYYCHLDEIASYFIDTGLESTLECETSGDVLD